MKNRFEIIPGTEHGEVQVNKRGIEQFHRNNQQDTLSSTLGDMGFTQEEFVREANSLLDKYNIEVPSDFPKPLITKEALFGDETVQIYHSTNTGICFCNCIQLERKHNIDTSKLLRELIKPDPVAGLLHATSISVIAIDYSDKGQTVKLFPVAETGKEPDLLVDDTYCDIKVIQESDWTKEALEEEHREQFLTTGMAPLHYIRDDLCFDIGNFIKNRGSEGIQQADMLLVDLSLKSMQDLPRISKVPCQPLPPPKRNRMVFFCSTFYTGKVDSAYYLDFDPSLWKLIKTCDKTRQRGWLPFPLGWIAPKIINGQKPKD